MLPIDIKIGVYILYACFVLVAVILVIGFACCLCCYCADQDRDDEVGNDKEG